ncbi:MAG TPA: DinB family protein [Anaerolineales bacterium]|nr:DinB family protein [Anaerolineales bacterium]
MDLKEYLTVLYDYNYWANHRYLAVTETLTEEQFFRKQGHSWDSVQRVLVHMMSSERMWPQRWRGEKGAFLDPNDFPTAASVRDSWAEIEKDMRALLAEQTEQSLLREVTYTNPKGETFTLPLWQMMAHVPNHNTHHRGELAAMFTLMDVQHPEEEVVQYFLVKSGQRKEQS